MFKFITKFKNKKHGIEAENVRLKDELASVTEKFYELTTRDDLTGLYNRRYIYEIVENEFKKAKRYKTPVTALLAGIDGLKKINQTYGHGAGNQVLKDFASVIMNAIREVDIAGRLESDEFLIILPTTDIESSMPVAERVLGGIRKKSPTSEQLAQNPTTSIGIAEWSPLFKTADDWILALRRALSEAKREGRDRVFTIDQANGINHLALHEDRETIEKLQGQIHSITTNAKNSYFKDILSLIEANHYFKKFVFPHSERVAFFADKLATKIGMQADEILSIKRGSLLHDAGKVAIDQKILLKNKSLSSTEYELIKLHPFIGTQIIGKTIFWKNELAMILHHHERFDGSGYPDGLKKDHIPLGARILAVAEAWDTMTTEQAYRKALPIDKAISEIKQNSGTQFDPELAKTFTQMIEG